MHIIIIIIGDTAESKSKTDNVSILSSLESTLPEFSYSVPESGCRLIKFVDSLSLNLQE